MDMTSSSARRPSARVTRRSKLRSFVTLLQVTILLCMGAFVGVALGLFVSLSKALPTFASIEAPEATIIYSSDGTELGRIFHEDRTNVPLNDIPKNLREATIAIEDSRFYEHPGIDMRGIARAIFRDVQARHASEGASTITQQLARSVYLTSDKTMQRKVQEAVLAILIERKYTKDKILELYLNQVYYGSGAFGVQAASKVYFGKDVKDLDLSEAALIAGLPQRPSYYSPHERLHEALDRRDTVLSRMAELGIISQSEAEKAKEEKLDIVRRRNVRQRYKAPHFVDYVTKLLRERYSDEAVMRGGLRVYTTLDYRMQKIAEVALRQEIKKHELGHKVTEGCMIVIEPQNGYIRAMVGSVDPNSQFNRCVQGPGRQPGSSFKAFVYTAAFMAGMTPNDRVPMGHVYFPDGNGGIWSPRNYDGLYSHAGSDMVSIKQAVAWSINTSAVYTANKVGIKNVIKYAQLMGIHSELEPYLSTAIGGVKGVHPLEMASAYGTFANNGVHVPASAIIRVTNSRGEPIEDYIPEGTQVIPPKINAEMDELFRGVVTMPRGTGGKMRDVPEARGKTGTTNDDRDAWWIGYIPNKLVAAVWAGNDNNAPMNGAYGSVVCAPAWKEFMLKAIPIYNRMHTKTKAKVKTTPSDTEKHDTNAAEKKPDRPTVEPVADVNQDDGTINCKICDDSQLLATKACPSTHIEKFAKGTEPTSYCTTHTESSNQNSQQDVTLVTVTICPDSGMLAGKYCPKTAKKRLPIDQVPSQTCTIHTKDGSL